MPERLLVERERALEKRRAGERDQGEPVVFRLLHQVERGEFGAREAIGLHVFRQHAARGVDGHHDVETALFGLLLIETPLRPGQCQHRAGDRENDQGEPELLPRL